MALQLNDTTAIIHRTSGFVPGTSDYTCCFWFQPTFTLSNFVNYVTAFALVNADYSEWVGIYAIHTDEDSDHSDRYDLDSTTVFHGFATVDRDARCHFAYVRSGTTHRLYRDGVLVGEGTEDLSALVFAEAMLGYDGFSVLEGPLRFAEWREWNAALTPTQIQAEMASHTVVRTANLFANTPLTTDLLDISGHGHHWVGAGDFEFVTWSASAHVYNLTGPVRQSGGAILCFVGPPWKTVEWRIISGGGTLTPFTTHTDAYGRASCRFDCGYAGARNTVVVGVAFVP